MLKHVYNIRAITNQLKKTQEPNAYHKLTQAFRGIMNIAPVEMIEEVEKIIDREHKKTKEYISKLKREAKQLEKVA